MSGEARCWCGADVGFRADKGFYDCLADRRHDWRGHQVPARETAVGAVLAVMDGRIVRENRRVEDWPKDERDLHRAHRGSFDERADDVSHLIASKIVRAVLESTRKKGRRCPSVSTRSPG